MAYLSETQLIASVTKESYQEFIKEFWDTVVAERLVWNWHLDVLCDEFQEAAERMMRGEPSPGDLVANVPPGTSKSLIFSVFSMPWLWAHDPSLKGIFGSHADDLSIELSVKARDCVQSDKYRACFPHVELRSDQNAKGLFATTARGWRFATSVGGNVTGRHAHIIVIDDPLDPQMAWAEKEAEGVNRWLKHTLPSRRVDLDVCPQMLVMQRLAPNDPTRLFLKRGARHVCLPARLSGDVRPKHLRKYYRKGLLDPVRKGPPALRRAEQDLGSYAFQGQYMQRPGPKGGAMFKTDRFILIDSLAEIGEEVVMWARGWDKAGTQDGGSFTVGAKLGKTQSGRFVVSDVRRDQIDSGRREIWIRRTAEQDGYGVKVGVEQEGASGGKESAENTVRNLAGFSVEVIKVGKSLGDLVHRADPFSTQVNNGNVFVLKRDWTEEFVEEFKHFPNGKYNDQVAACACVAFPMLYRRRRRKGGFQELLYSNLEKEMQRR